MRQIWCCLFLPLLVKHPLLQRKPNRFHEKLWHGKALDVTGHRERNPSVTGILRVVHKRQVMRNFDVFSLLSRRSFWKKNQSTCRWLETPRYYNNATVLKSQWNAYLQWQQFRINCCFDIFKLESIHSNIILTILGKIEKNIAKHNKVRLIGNTRGLCDV